MFSDLANALSSPLVHGPITFIILRVLLRYTERKWWQQAFTYLPVAWVFLCASTYPSILLVRHLENKFPPLPLTSTSWQSADAIVVMACYYFDDENLPLVSRWPRCSLQRNLQAAMLYKIKKMPIYLAGGKLFSKDRLSQAEFNKSVLVKLGVDEHDIVVITRGYNTKTEVQALSDSLSAKKIVLITSAAHMLRAVGYFSHSDTNIIASPVDYLARTDVGFRVTLPNAQSLYRSERAIHEYLGLLEQHFQLQTAIH